MTALLMLLACPHGGPGGPASPEELLARASTPAPEGAVVSRFDMNVSTPTTRGPASGTLLVDPPDRFYLEVRPPVGGPALVAACDGTVVSAWIAGQQKFFSHPAAEEGLRGLTRGAIGLEAIVSLLTGRVPPLGAPQSLLSGPATIDAEWAGPNGTRLKVGIDPAKGRLVRMVGLDGTGALAVQAALLPGPVYPLAMNVEIPRLQTTVEIEFGPWKVADVPDARYKLTAPAGVQVLDLSTLGASSGSDPVVPEVPSGLEVTSP